MTKHLHLPTSGEEPLCGITMEKLRDVQMAFGFRSPLDAAIYLQNAVVKPDLTTNLENPAWEARIARTCESCKEFNPCPIYKRRGKIEGHCNHYDRWIWDFSARNCDNFGHEFRAELT